MEIYNGRGVALEQILFVLPNIGSKLELFLMQPIRVKFVKNCLQWTKKDERRCSVRGGQADFSEIAKKTKFVKHVTCVECARKPRENIETLNMDSRSGLTSIKLMEETDVSVQIYSFLEVTGIRYDEKPEKYRPDVISGLSVIS